MNMKQKVDALRELSHNFHCNQAIVFSDEGNLGDVKNIYDEEQDREWRKKPSGLWFSLGASWISWFGNPYSGPDTWALKRLQWITHIYRIYLAKSVLKIYTVEEFDKFEKEYARTNKKGVNWRKVAQQYDGILIRHQKNRGIDDSHWYNGWDVSGGCMWRRSGIRGTKLLKAWRSVWKEVA